MQCVDYRAIMGTITAILSPVQSPLPQHHSDSKPITAVKLPLSSPLPQGLEQEIPHVILYRALTDWHHQGLF